MRDAHSKIVSREKLRALLEEHRCEGKQLVLSNGCFDTLHVGHVRYLEGARLEGDILVTAVNADASVHALKGFQRPILNEEARARLVAALRCVDYVVIFAEPDVNRLLEELRPHVHAKGTDYTVETVPERATAERFAIRVAIVGDAKDHSTRALLETIRKDHHG
ncbi:MAG: adenylyltransferase/cytidyltransferase family protein [Candidatus Acidiferrum sp.]|jgi:rfaE bifunctional protein nucleotidyltransferase chain/domain